MAGIYIHIPFCKQACHYCNFHFSTSLAMKNDFTAALLKEISLRADYLENELVETIYFGGGTPSLLAEGEILEILQSIREHFKIDAAAEITLEANPDDIDPPKLACWKNAGINRLSLGVQSFFGEDLLWMNRAHDEKQAVRSVLDAQSAGLDNISIDLIYGLPDMTDERWKKNTTTAVSLGVPHLSCYALTVEPKTALQKKIKLGKMPDIVQEDQARQFLEGIQWLEESGYQQYEISNFALPGKRSRHNSAYWQSGKYLGLGPSAHSFNGNTRQWNVAHNARYIRSLNQNELCFEIETLKPADRLNEYIMTSLRTMEGLDLQYVLRTFGPEKKNLLEKNASRYISADQMTGNDEKLILTRAGKLFADGISAALFFE
ncbi:MAG: radical SAM family heme chaperone HemW [Bacteroidota bacterium]|nr:radical SAM family heme chaperone HemW [Bacteroidota bacterium]